MKTTDLERNILELRNEIEKISDFEKYLEAMDCLEKLEEILIDKSN